MTGIQTIRKIQRLHSRCRELGFYITESRHSYNDQLGDCLSIKPLNDHYPIYNRDAEIFCGTLESLEQWLNGMEWARSYDSMMFGSKHNQKRERKEQDYRNKYIVDILKGEKPSTIDNYSVEL